MASASTLTAFNPEAPEFLPRMHFHDSAAAEVAVQHAEVACMWLHAFFPTALSAAAIGVSGDSAMGPPPGLEPGSACAELEDADEDAKLRSWLQVAAALSFRRCGSRRDHNADSGFWDLAAWQRSARLPTDNSRPFATPPGLDVLSGSGAASGKREVAPARSCVGHGGA